MANNINSYGTWIETVIVEVNGKTVDCVSFSSIAQSEAFKRGVRDWAAKRGMNARIYCQVMEVTHKERDSRRAPAPLLAVAV